MRVAYCTLLPPQRSGIADYNESLVREIARHVDLELFLDDIVPAHPEIRDAIPWRSSRDFARLHRDRPYDLIVYQMGNNVLHGRHYRLACHFPGIVLLHDYALRFFFPLVNDTFSFLETRDDLDRYGGLPFPKSMAAPQILGSLDLIEHPLNERLIERSLGIVVHSHWSRDRIRRRFADKPVEVVPFGVDPDPRAHASAHNGDGAAFRRAHRIAPDAFVVTCAGNVTPNKRIDIIVRAFAELVALAPQSVLCIVGHATVPRYFQELHQLVNDLHLQPHVRFLGYVGMEDFYGVLDMSDVCLNLRYPTLGETSAVQLRMMELAKPIIITAVAQFAEFPDSVCWKVDVGGAEQAQLVRCLSTLARSPETRRQLGENARWFVRDWTWDRVALLHVEAWDRIARLSKRIGAYGRNYGHKGLRWERVGKRT